MKVAQRQLDELLETVNNSSDVEQSLRDIIDTPYVRLFLEQNVNEVWPGFELLVEPKYSDFHRSMAGALLLSKPSATVLKEVILNQSSQLKNRRYQLKSLIEMLYSEEAKILQAILKKDLTSIYPNITHELICKVL